MTSVEEEVLTLIRQDVPHGVVVMGVAFNDESVGSIPAMES